VFIVSVIVPCMCELELDWLDMRINTKKSCSLRVGLRYDLSCAGITTSDGYSPLG